MMDIGMSSNQWMRSLLSGGAPSAGSQFCLDKNVSYAHRVDNPEGWNWCLVPDGGYDAVFFAGLAIAAMCLASPRWDALIVLFFGGIYFTFSYYWNLENVSNAVMLWLGMRPADIFVFVFLPPFLLDLSVRIDFFMLKKVAFNIAFMAFFMVAASALLLIPFMLYALDLKSSGWTAGYVALFGSMIASTDAASVSAVLRSGGGPEILSVLLEGESLFNDASSLTLFEIFKEVVLEDAKTTLANDLQGIVVKTIWSAFTGICIGLAMGIFTKWVFAWLQHRNVEAMAEVAWSVAGAYLSFYITQVWCKGSGCIGAVAYGLYGSATLLWGMSTKARLSGIFTQFWAVMTFVINGLIFFYVGASSVNFTIRSAQSLYADSGGIQLVKILLYKLPLIFLASFALRFILIFFSFKLLQLVRLSEGLSIQEVIFVTVGGLRGSLSLVLAQSAATLASTHDENHVNRRVKAEIAIYTAGYVIMTLLINAPICGPLLTLLGLDKIRQEQLAMRGEVKNLFRKFTMTAIEDLAAGQDDDELLQGLDWAMLKLHTNFDKQLDKELPEIQPRVRWLSCNFWLGALAAPLRLWHYLVACFRGRCNPDAMELITNEERLSRQRQEAELKRATNINVRDLNRGESRAPGAFSMPFASGPVRLPTALVIRDPTGTTSSGTTATVGRGLTGGPNYSAASGASRRPPAAVTTNSLRRSGSQRLSSLVVAPPGAAVGVDREVSVHGGRGGFNRNSSRFLEGAVVGPTAGRMSSLQLQQQYSPAGGSSPEVRERNMSDNRADTVYSGENDGIVEGPQIEVLLSVPSTPADDAQQQGKPRGTSEQQQYGRDGGADGEGASLLDPQLATLASTREIPRDEAPSDSPVVDAVPAAGAPAEVSATAAAAAVSQLPAKMSSHMSGGDSLIDAALLAVGNTMTAGPEAEDPELQPQPGSGPLGPASFLPGASPRASAPSSPKASNVLPWPSSRSRRTVGGVGGGNIPSPVGISRLHVSTSLSKLNSLEQQQQSAGVGAGATSEPEMTAPRTSGERGLLQSVLVIKPGAMGRGSALPSSTLGQSATVRLVQRLGDDSGRGSALEALRTDAVPAGARGLGRGSVRLAPTAMSPVEFAQPPASESEASLPAPFSAFAAADRPLARTSASAPTAGKLLGRSSGVVPHSIGEGNMRSMGSEPPCLSPFEFALPEDFASGAPATDTFRPSAARGGGGEAASLGRGSVCQGAPDGGLGRSSVRAGCAPDGGGGLARPSVRQGAAAGAGGGGGGALGRASVRLGRQAGLAAVSTHLARIYDTDGTAGASAIDARPSLASLELPPPRASITTDGRQQSGTASPVHAIQGQSHTSASNHIALQVQKLQHRDSQQMLASQSQGPAQYSLGVSGKNVLMSLIRRSVGQMYSNSERGGVGVGRSSTRDLSGRGPELSRRTRFADSNTATALARASASGTLIQMNSEVDGGGSVGVSDPLLVEYRLRLLTGLKQYYKQKHAAGSLSPSAYKVLSYIADQSAHHPEQPLSLWTMAKGEISSGLLMEVEVAVYFRLKQWTAAAKASSVTLVRTVVPRMLVPFVRLISSHTSAATLRGLETAVELWASLTQSLQTEWLQYSGAYGERLLEEVQLEADGTWAYIIERRIEAPKKFGAVQTHRAVIDVLTQQQAFVREMNEGGMIEESECRKIVEMVEKRLQLLARRGPRWRQPTVMEILMGTAVLRGVSPRVVEWIRKESTFRVYPQGAAIWDMGRKQAGAEPDGLIIVIRGVVRMMLEQDGALVPYYLGAGGVGGLISCVLENHVPGMSSAAAYAEGNALGKGPLVMHVPWPVLQVLKRFSRDLKMAPYQALDLQMYRTAAVYVLDLLRQQVTQQFSAFIRSSLLTILSSERLDGPTARRQRIRLLLQPAASDHIVDGAIDWIKHLLDTELDVARQLLDPTAGNIPVGGTTAGTHYYNHLHSHNHSHSHSHSHGSAHHLANVGLGTIRSDQQQQQQQQQQQTLARLAASPWVEVMYKAIAAATGAVLDIIRTSLKDSILMVLGPKQGIVQRSTMVLIQGTLEPAPIADADGKGGSAGMGGPFVASNNEFHVAPSVMVWVSDYFQGELVAQKELRVVAGPRGATLLLWGVHPEDLLLHSPTADPVGGASLPSPRNGGAGGETAAKANSGRAAAAVGKGDQSPKDAARGGGFLSVAKSIGIKARQEGSKVKPDAVATAAKGAARTAVNGGQVGGDGVEGKGVEPKAAEVNGAGEGQGAKL